MDDNDKRTAWIEGVEGYGIGEYILFKFSYRAPRATSVMLVNGYAKSEKTWKNSSRVKTFNIYDDDTLIAIVHLQDTRNTQGFDLPYPFPKRSDDYNYSSEEEDEKNSRAQICYY